MKKKLFAIATISTVALSLLATSAIAAKPDPTPPGYATVAKVGGDYTDPVAAMSDLAAWCGTPSADNPCMLKIRPGVYDLGDNPFYLTGYVDIEGSGKDVTVITSTLSSGVYNQSTQGKVGIRNLTIEGLSIRFIDGADMNITNVNVIGSGIYCENTKLTILNSKIATSGGDIGVNLFMSPRRATMQNVEIYTNGQYGIATRLSTLSLNNVKVGANSYAINIRDYPTESVPDMVDIRNSHLDGVWYALKIDYNHSFRVATLMDSTVTGPLPQSGGDFKCANVYNSNLDPMACQ